MMRTKNIYIYVGQIAVLLACQPLGAAPSQVPIFLTSGTESMVMLNMSNDHELFFKAYDDYSDLDPDRKDVNGDPAPDGVETTYKHEIDYYGYFEPTTCYSYSSGEFVPQTAGVTGKYCNGVSGDWSGNFLNWATMTRMDAIRKVLYGGYRSTDTATKTVLERTFLPTDAHSFVKYYNGTDINKLTSYNTDISICNTTQSTTNNSRDVTDPPLMRVAQGNFSMWTAHEQVQCQWSQENNNSNNNQPAITGIPAATNPPSRLATGSAEFIVRIEACKSVALAESNCKVYPDGNRKPIGALQEHGDDGEVKFGLMTGSYQKNKSGGVLRKNVSDFRDEVNEDSDGTFAAAPAGGGIVDTINKLRLTRYAYSNTRYNDLDSCGFGKFGFANGECSNWGNPQSEIYLESLRYFGGLGATGDFAANDSGYINGLGTATWTDPLNNDNYCAPISIIHFNASTSSFDGDDLGGFSSLPGSPSADDLTDDVGAGEGVTSAGRYFVGEATGSTDKSCTPKALDGGHLSDAEGVCPEAPWLEGTYKIAGMAYYANLNSIRTDLTDIDNATADIFVKTYGVALTPAQPIIRIPVPGNATQEVYLLPACMEFRDGGNRHNGNCAIVDFRIVEPHSVASGVGTGKFMVLWESAQHGGDYDQDMGGIIEYSIDSSEITVTTQVYGASTGGIHGFGYVIAGTDDTDGLHIHSGHNNFSGYTDPDGLLDCSVPCNSGDPASSETYTLGTSAAVALETPLYYAAKWGGFKEEQDSFKRPSGVTAPDDIPNETYEWDTNVDGLPDNYFFARNPGALSSQLAKVFQLTGGASSSASVVANSVSLQTTTRIYQARFNSTGWVGRLLSFPVTVSTGALQNFVWDAGLVIADQVDTAIAVEPDPTDANYSDGRVWVTWNGTAGIPFQWASLTTGTGSQQDLLNINPDTGLDDGLGSLRLDFLRGSRANELAESSPIGPFFRNRIGEKEVLDANGNMVMVGNQPLMESYWTPLGDAVHSTPTVVAAPPFAYADSGYSAFKLHYGDSDCFEKDINGNLVAVTNWTAGSGTTAGGREPMVYFGANDGALHGVSACTGEERLAYVPNAVFPDLSKLTSLDYAHQYYVDGPPTAVDAYFADAMTPAWHTVLVGTLRGGGKAVFALDVTDPDDFTEANASSIVLWEIDDTTDMDADSSPDYPELGYTFSQPAVIKAEGQGWVAVFGNGYHSASGTAVLYIADIEDGSLLETIDLSTVDATAHGSGNGLSTVSPIDKDGDGDVDIIYAGDLNGNIWRFAADPVSGFSGATTSLLYTAKNATGADRQPITSRMAVGLHPTSAVGRIIYFGTGKYYEPADQDPANAVQFNTMYGIWDRDTGATVSTVTTRNSNTLQQQTVVLQPPEETFECNPNPPPDALPCTPEDFYVRVVSDTQVTWAAPSGACGIPDAATGAGSCGWYLDLPDTGEKMVATPVLRGGRLIFVTTIPSLIPCAAGGTGWLMEIDPATGGRMDEPLFDLNGDAVFDDYDNLETTVNGATVFYPISGKKSKVGILQPPAILSGVGGAGDGSYGGAEGKYSSGTRNAQIEVTIENPGLLGAGRKSWTRIK
jgi:type IV pilus assembly protein PilY1